MKFLRHLIIVSILAAPLANADQKPGPVGAQQDDSRNGKKREAIDVRALLEKGRASGSLPEGMVIRVSACLGAPDKKVSEERLPAEIKETWEFTSRQVRCVRLEDTNDRSSDHPIESRSFDSSGICNDLLEGKAIEIQAGKGKGPEVGFIASHYHAGGRSIEVLWKGEAILNLYETNGPFLKLYRESDARAFGALYERLASQARILFKSKPTESQ